MIDRIENFLLGELLFKERDYPRSCVYVIWDCEGVHPVYIGKTTAFIDRRIYYHLRGGFGGGQSWLGKHIEKAEPFSWDWIVECHNVIYEFSDHDEYERTCSILTGLERDLVKEKKPWLNSQPSCYPPDGTPRPWWYPEVVIEDKTSIKVAERLGL